MKFYPFKDVLQRKLIRFDSLDSRIFSFNPFEAQIDTGNMMHVIKEAVSKKYFNSQPANSYPL
jgi:hypothetical protein